MRRLLALMPSKWSVRRERSPPFGGNTRRADLRHPSQSICRARVGLESRPFPSALVHETGMAMDSYCSNGAVFGGVGDYLLIKQFDPFDRVNAIKRNSLQTSERKA